MALSCIVCEIIELLVENREIFIPRWRGINVSAPPRSEFRKGVWYL